MSDDLKFTSHCQKIARNAHYRRRQFQQSFAYKDRKFQVEMFCSYIRPIVESSSIIWSPHAIGDINCIEDVQRKFTKYLPGLFDTSYPARLQVLGMESLEIRRIKSDLIFFYKMIHGLVDLDVNDYVTFNQRTSRGHPYKVNIQYSRVNCRKYFYTNRVAPIWNSLTLSAACSLTLSAFKKEIDKIDFSSYCRGCAHTAP